MSKFLSNSSIIQKISVTLSLVIIAEYFCNSLIFTYKDTKYLRDYQLFYLYSYPELAYLLIDTIKTYMCKGLWSFLADQFAHILILCLISCKYMPTSRLPIQSIDFLDILSIPLFAFAILCCLKPTNILIKLVLDKYKIGDAESCQSIKNAGALIGNLERILTMVFVLIGQYEAVGFIVAAKSLLRFKETDTAKTEYVLAGTLLSFGIATILGLLVKHLFSEF